MDKNIDVNIKAELKADLQPVIASTPSALNKLFELLFGVSYAKKKHIIEMIEAQKTKDKTAISDGLAIFNIEELKLKTLDINVENNAISLIENSVTNDEVRNILNCAKHTADVLIDKAEFPEKEISKDFFNRWRNEAKLIDDDYAQSIWGRILAEEIQHPETISLRVLDTLKNLSKSEAELFNKMGNYVVFGQSMLTGEHITESQIRVLVEANLVVFAGMYRTAKWPRTKLTYKDNAPQPGHYFDFNSTLFFTDDIPIENDLSFNFIPLTTQGKAIYRISSRNNDWDLKLIAKAIFISEKQLNKLTAYKYVNHLKNNDINMDKPVYFYRSDFDTESQRN